MEKLRILIAEDESIIAEDIKASLERSGYTVVAVTASASQAITKAEELEPDLVLMDIQLQDRLGGLEAAEQIRAHLDIPVVYLTAYADPSTIRRAIATRSFGYIIKPFDEKELEETIEMAMGNYRVERSLEQSKLWLGTILESVSDAVIAIDRAEYITYINPAAENLTGWRQTESVGKRWSDVFQTADEAEQPVDSLDIIKVLAEGRPLERADQALQTKAKTRVFIESGVAPIRDRQGHITGAVIIFRDITRRKRLEAALRQRAKELVAADRAKDEFIAMLSHELRTPLNAILGWALLLRTGKLDAEGIQHAINTIERNAKAQAQLISDLMDMSRIITGNLRLEAQPVQLESVVEAALDTVRPGAQAKSVRLETTRDRLGGVVMGDSARLHQVVWNLLTNAIKFTPSGGLVEIRLKRADTYAELSIKDTGIGINPKFLPYIFDRFRQADDGGAQAQGGIGLGLAIVRHLVKLHGGVVQAESPGEMQGTTFTVRLPLHSVSTGTAAGQADRAGAADVKAPMLTGIHVLLIDDESDALEVTGLILGQLGATVAAASTGEALATIKRSRPDVLVSDLGMPLEDGYALIHQVRALPPEQGGQIPAVALTAYAQIHDSRRALAAGYQIHISKPVDPEELATAIASLTGRAPQGTCGPPP